MENEKLFNKGYIVFTLLQTINFVLFYMSYPIITKFAHENGIPLTIIGIIAAAGTLGAFFTRPFAGFSMDHLNKKICIILSLIISGLSTIALIINSSFLFISAMRLIYGASFAFSSIALTSCATNFIPKDKIGEGIGYIGLGIAIAAAIGPVFGIYIADIFGYHVLFLTIGILSIAGGIKIIFSKTKERPREKKDLKFTLNSFVEKKALSYAVFVIPFAFASGFVASFIALVADMRGINHIPVFFTMYAIAMMILKPLSGKVMDKNGIVAVMVPAFICAALGTGLIAIGTSLSVMIIASIFLAFGQGAGQPSLQAQCIKIVDSTKTGIAISTYYLGLDVGNMLGSMCGSAIASTIGYTGAYLFCTIFLLFALITFLIMHKFHKKTYA